MTDHRRKVWKGPVLYTAVGALLGGTLFAAAPALAASNFNSFWGGISQNGQSSSGAQAVSYDGTSFFGIWYLQKLLSQDGISTTWNGRTLSLSNMPTQQPTTLSVTNSSGATVSAPINSLSIDGVTYVPLSTLQSLLQQEGLSVQLQAGSSSGQGSQGDDNDNHNWRSNNYEVISAMITEAADKLQDFANEQQGSFSSDADRDHFEQLLNAIAKIQMAEVMLTWSGSQSVGSGGPSYPLSAQGNGGSGLGTGAASGTASGSSSSSTSTSSATGSGSTGSTASSLSIAQALQADVTALNTIASSVESGGSLDSSSLTQIIANLKTQAAAVAQLQGSTNSWGSGNSADEQNGN